MIRAPSLQKSIREADRIPLDVCTFLLEISFYTVILSIFQYYNFALIQGLKILEEMEK